jgi:hypothetical protein
MKIEIPSLEQQDKVISEQGKMASIYIYCTKEEKSALVNHSKKQGRKLGEWCLEALKEKLERETKLL